MKQCDLTVNMTKIHYEYKYLVTGKLSELPCYLASTIATDYVVKKFFNHYKSYLSCDSKKSKFGNPLVNKYVIYLSIPQSDWVSVLINELYLKNKRTNFSSKEVTSLQRSICFSLKKMFGVCYVFANTAENAEKIKTALNKRLRRRILELEN